MRVHFASPTMTALAAALLLLALVAHPAAAQGTSGIVNNNYGYALYKINTLTNEISTLTSTTNPTFLGALSPHGTTYWVATGDGMSVIRATSGTLLYRMGYLVASRPTFSLDGDRVYYLASTSPISLIARDTAGYAIVDSFALAGITGWYCHPVLSADGTKLYFSDYNYVYEIDVRTGQSPRKISLYSITRLKMHPGGTKLYAQTGYGIYAIDLATMTSTNVMSSSYFLTGMEFNRAGTKLYVTTSSSNTLYTLDVATNTTTQHSLPSAGNDIALSPTDTLLYVANGNYGSANIMLYSTTRDTVIGTLSVNSYPTSITMPLPLDGSAPAAIGDLQVVATSFDAMRLVFTAPGDDGSAGTARFYAVRVDTLPITAGNFGSARRFTADHAPHPGGTADTIDVTGLLGSRTYYVAIRAGDEVVNVSPIATGSVALPPPPIGSVSPDSLSAALSDNDSVALHITIANAGGADLVYTLRVGATRRLVAGASPEAPPAAAFAAAPARTILDGTCAPSGTDRVVDLGARTAVAEPPPTPLPSGVTGPKVLLLHSEYLDLAADVALKIRQTGKFSVVDTLDLRLGLPSQEQLRRYDAVLIWLNYFLSTTDQLGDLLADYVDYGGGLVVCDFALSVNPSTYLPQIGGRFQSQNYWVMTPGPINQTHDGLFLGTVLDRTHPVMQGVNSFIGNHSYRVVNPQLVAGSTRIANWSDGSALVAERVVGASRRVDLNMFPPSSDVGYGELWGSASDGARLMGNCLEYVAGGSGLTTRFAPASGSVAAGSSTTVEATIVTKNSRSGSYLSSILVGTNDPLHPQFTIPFAFSITDRTPPHISLQFFQNEELTQYMTIVSVAREPLVAPSLTIGVAGDSTVLPLVLGDSARFVYRAQYRAPGPGTVTASLAADDSVGNRSVLRRQYAVALGSATTASGIGSPDGQGAMSLPAGTLSRALYLVCQEGSSAPVDLSLEPVGASYAFGPAGETLAGRATLTLRIPPGEAVAGRAEHLVIHRWNGVDRWLPVATSVDVASRTARAEVEGLGEYRLFVDPRASSLVVSGEVPASYVLEANYPNPFNPSTTIRYGLPEPGVVSVVVLSLLGQEVRTIASGHQEAGFHTAAWDGRTAAGAPAASGIYFYRLKAGSATLTGKMMLMK